MQKEEPRQTEHGAGNTIRSLTRFGWTVILGAIVPIGGWAGLAPLSMAVVAPGFVTADLHRRPVQHLEGGIVREVLVRDGDQVEAGAPLLMLTDVRVDADRNRVQYRIHLERAAIARLMAEQARQPQLQFPEALLVAGREDVRIREGLEKEKSLFAARRDSLTSETRLLKAQRPRIESELTALRAQIAQLEKSLKLQLADLELNRGLQADGFISAARVSKIEASVVDYAARLDERRSELARAKQRMGEVDMRIKSLENAYVQSASDELTAAAGRLAELEQELRKSEDMMARQVVAAPARGEVIGLKVTSAGSVIRPGETIAEIVPKDDKLIIEARIRPEEVNHVHVDQRARVKFSAFKYRNVTMVEGKVMYVSGDRLVDPVTNMPYFNVIIQADEASLAAVGDVRLHAGMPAEVFIEGTSQTTLQYLAEPVMSTIRRAGREM